jgi:hypothetical protein
MTRALVLPIPTDALESLRALGELGARLGGPYELAGQIIASRLDALPAARAARRDEAVVALWNRAGGSARERAQAVASALRRYSATRWLRERAMHAAPLVGGEEGRLLFAVMKSGGAVGFEAIRKIVRNAGDSVGFGSPLSITHAAPQNANNNEDSPA